MLGFQINENFLGVLKFCGYSFGVITNWTNLGAISMCIGSFLTVKVQNGGCFLGLLKFQIFFFGGGGGGGGGRLKSPEILFRVNGRCWA